MNAVGLYQSEAAPQVRIGTTLTMMAERHDSVLQDATKVFFFEETLVLVPNESPMCGHGPVLVQPALGTQELRLQTLGAHHRPKLSAASAWREQLRVVMEGVEDLEENGLLSPQFVHVSHTLKEY